MSYPDDLEWNQPGVEPTQAKKDEGWKPEEKPPAEYFNWFFNRTSQAVKYLKGESDKSVDDDKIGNRTITDTVTAVTGANTLTNLLSMLGNMIKKITGKSAWYTAPATTLEAANTHITATGNPHNTTAAQVGAAPDGYGLGTAAASATGDWNNYYADGFYVGLNLTNAPTTGADTWYLVNVICYNTTYVYQQAHGFSGAAALTWERTCNNGVWGAWRQLATMNLVAPAGYGLGGVGTRLSAVNYNTVVQNGWYDIEGGTNGPGSTIDTFFKLLVVASGDVKYVSQMAFTMTSTINAVYTRQMSANVWGAWKQLATTDNSGNANTLSGLSVGGTGDSGPAWPFIPQVKSDGVIEIGLLLDFHNNSGDAGDYALRLAATDGVLKQIVGTTTKTFATTDQIPSISAPGTAPLYACRAWATFDGSTTTPTISASGNISSIVKNSTGNYTINFITPMSHANYAAFGSISASAYTDWFFHPQSYATTSFTCNFTHGSSAGDGIINLSIFC